MEPKRDILTQQQFLPQLGGKMHGVRTRKVSLWKQVLRCHGRLREPTPQAATPQTATSQARTSQAGGLTDCSRWLSEAWRATPPVFVTPQNRIPEGCQNSRVSISGTPPGCGYFYHVVRWRRPLTRPQPPAKIFQASGLKNHRKQRQNRKQVVSKTPAIFCEQLVRKLQHIDNKKDINSAQLVPNLPSPIVEQPVQQLNNNGSPIVPQLVGQIQISDNQYDTNPPQSVAKMGSRSRSCRHRRTKTTAKPFPHKAQGCPSLRGLPWEANHHPRQPRRGCLKFHYTELSDNIKAALPSEEKL